ncbi:MAG: hypothetical protein J5626_04185 [Lachnospiraceae bacterium]|nr:hypothetical protein [Lachnospiraceae bacterium]
MKRILSCALVMVLCAVMLGGCSDEAAAKATEGSSVQSAAKEDGKTAIKSDATDNELGWDGTWKGGSVEVTITGSNNGSLDVYIVDEEMHTSLDEASINGNTLTGVYRITLEMYPDPDADVPEQEWSITMVKDGATASYSRTAELTWFTLNEDGTYGRSITKENSATLTLVTNKSTN